MHFLSYGALLDFCRLAIIGWALIWPGFKGRSSHWRFRAFAKAMVEAVCYVLLFATALAIYGFTTPALKFWVYFGYGILVLYLVWSLAVFLVGYGLSRLTQRLRPPAVNP